TGCKNNSAACPCEYCGYAGCESGVAPCRCSELHRIGPAERIISVHAIVGLNQSFPGLVCTCFLTDFWRIRFMKHSDLLIRSAVAGLVAFGLASAGSTALAAKGDNEKCAGIAKAGKNDCGTAGHSCAGQA